MYSYSDPVFLQVDLGDAQAANTVTVPGNMITEGGTLTNVRVVAINGLAGATPAAHTISFGVSGTIAKFGTFVDAGASTANEKLEGTLTLTTDNFRNLDEEPVLITCAAPVAAAAQVSVVLAYY